LKLKDLLFGESRELARINFNRGILESFPMGKSEDRLLPSRKEEGIYVLSHHGSVLLKVTAIKGGGAEKLVVKRSGILQA
jgi:hypothetical protein